MTPGRAPEPLEHPERLEYTVTVDVEAAVPPYEQVRAQIAGHISAGRLGQGQRLPSARALAADLGLAAGTVDRAYRELEAATGLVSRRRCTGTVVTVSRSRAERWNRPVSSVPPCVTQALRHGRRGDPGRGAGCAADLR